LKKIGAITLEDNTASRKLLEKLGLQFLKMIQVGDDPEELCYYELINPTYDG
jgi:RimJ/RimL family protein N-acetyltransferase